MKKWNQLTRYQAFRWLWRFDSEAKWYWLRVYLFSKSNLQDDVWQNLKDFGVCKYDY